MSLIGEEFPVSKSRESDEMSEERCQVMDGTIASKEDLLDNNMLENCNRDVTEITTEGLEPGLIVPWKVENSNDVNCENFVIVKNPDFLPQINSNSSLNYRSSEEQNGFENEVLPPPRTLDDAPRRRRKKKASTSSHKAVQDVINSIKIETKPAKKIVDEEIIIIDDPDPSIQPGTSTSNAAGDFDRRDVDKLSPTVMLDNVLSQSKAAVFVDYLASRQGRTTAIKSDSLPSYNLRRKSVAIDYSCDILENASEFVEEAFPCSECSLSYKTKKDLKLHQIAAHGHEAFRCDECSTDFTSSVGLKRHVFMKHRKSKCSLCNKEFKAGQTLFKHIKLCGKISSIHGAIESREKPRCFPCSHCGKKFTERGNLARHVKLHKGILRFICNVCGKKCSEKQALESHIRYMHTGERPYKCNLCPKSFATRSDWRRHQTVHTNERKFACSDCGKAFKTREALKTHMKFKSGQKVWQCGVCSQRFVTKGGLKTHMVMHSSIKNYECETCQRQFSHRGSLEAHMRVHSGLMPHVCQVCGKKFAHIQNRNRHVRTMH